MGTGYTRNDTANNIADGNVINASDLDGEFDAIQAAFNASTGHSHDGTTGEGPQIGTGGIADLSVTTGKIANDAVTLGTKTSGNYVATIATSAGLDGSASSEGATPTISLNLNELTTSTTDGDGDYFVVVDTVGTQRKLTKANIAVSGFNTANGIALGTDTTGNYIATGAVSGVGLSGSASAEGATFTVTSNATDANTGSTIVARDASGNFSAGTITAALTGNVTGNVTGSSGSTTGNAATATALQTARTIAGNSFDGTANITIASTDLSDSGSINAATLDSIDSTSFLRSDAADTKTSGDLSFSDNVKAIFGAGNDLQIYHNGTHSYIQDTGTGNLKLRGTNVNIEANNGDLFFSGTEDAQVNLYYDNSSKLATTATGIDVTGTVTMDGGSTSADFSFGDNDKAIFGAGSDLEIFHDGSNSYVKDQGTGSLFLQGTDLRLRANNANTYVSCVEGGAVGLRYNNSEKLATTATGVDVTGVITTDGMTTSADINFGDNDKAVFGGGSDLQIYHDGSASIVYDNGTGPLNLQTNNSNINIKGGGSASDTMAIFKSTEGVDLYYNNVKKFETTSYGIDISGSVVADTHSAGSITGSQTPNFSTYQNFVWTLTGNITLANPTTEKTGQTGFFIFIHSGAARTVSLGTDYETAGGAGLTLSSTAGAVDIVPYAVQSAGNILLGAPQLAFS